MASRPSHSRENSASNGNNDHRPLQPSTLRQSHTPASRRGSSQGSDSAAARQPDTSPASSSASSQRKQAAAATESTPLIPADGQQHEQHQRRDPAHPGICTHGTFSPRPSSPADGIFGGRLLDDMTASETTASEPPSGVLDNAMSNILGTDDWKVWIKRRIRTKKVTQSTELAQQAGFRFTPMM